MGPRPGQRVLIGIPTFENKVLQRAVAMVLEATYEQSFMAPAHMAFGPDARRIRRCDWSRARR